MYKRFRIFFLRSCILLFILTTNTALANVVVNQEIHYISKVVFPISGISASNINACRWEVNGGVTLVLSFSRSTSLATFFVTHKLTPLHNDALSDDLCPPSIFSSNFAFPLTVNVEQRTFFASSPDGERKIQGSLSNDKVEGSYQFQSQGILSDADSHWEGKFKTSLKEIPGEFINVSQLSGEVLSTIPLGTSKVRDSIPDASTLITGLGGRVTLLEKLGSQITLNPKTILTRLPLKNLADREVRTLVLARGKIDSIISDRDRDRDYKLLTPIAKVELNFVNINNKRTTNDSAEFTIEYSQTEELGELSVSVTSGSVVVTDMDNNTSIVNASEELSYTASTHQTTWIQPADGGLLYGGVENTLGWTEYPGAVSYLLEYNFPNPKFSEDNSQIPEFVEQSIIITEDMYSIYEGLVVVNLMMPELPDSIVEARVFPLDAAGDIMGQSVSSDRTTLTFQ